jgi:hypothetical protein
MTVTSQTWPNSTGGTAVVYYDDETNKIVNILHNLNPGGESLFLDWLARERRLTPEEAAYNFSQYAEVRVFTVTLPDDPNCDIPPWNSIVPDVGYDRKLLGLLWKGMQYQEVAQVLGIDDKTLMNRVSLLRKQYGEEMIPKQEEIRSRFMKKK